MKDINDTADVRSTLISRNITVMGKRTSVRLEPEMWSSLREIAKREQCSTHELCSLISMRKKPRTSLTAAIRVFLMLYYRAASTPEGHERAGHGNFEHMKQRARMPSQFIQRPSDNINDKKASCISNSIPINGDSYKAPFHEKYVGRA